ncbi:ubiquitin-conjugating enzyme E2 Q2-like [Toxorhynchites rutilus septentrionalis]|uniref:ubiquitin-conjugating enzyme E2 Q2-like n=1 Tax=Toxorhynchites rutilus septentrionalis TaxID=329112 RepID=UPI002479CC87|nr:ubiquitin-conjugating enzyme E2 Q2-like [Toxorhynchites rutilus septentrionalis]
MAAGDDTLASELETLKEKFPKDHERFQILDGSVDGLRCRFIDNDGRSYFIRVHIVEPYPEMPPAWVAENDDSGIMNVLDVFANGSNLSNHLVNQVDVLLRELCRMFEVPLPVGLEAHELHASREGNNKNKVTETDKVSNGDTDAVSSSTAGYKTRDQKLENLEKIRLSQKSKDPSASSSSVLSTNRLMREIQEIYRSYAYNNQIYTLELVDDSLYEWIVHLKTVDPDSLLHQDLIQLKQREGVDSIRLNIRFKESYPFEPPFVRIVYPHIVNGFVLKGGALCMELLTDRGWSPAYSMEAVIVQIAASLVKGNARIMFNVANKKYNLERAQSSFRELVRLHEKRGWYTPPTEDG